jgi:hypothetical protein
MKPNEFEGKSHPFLHRGQKRHKKPGKQIKKGVAYCRRLAGRTYQLSSGGQVSLRIEKSPRRRCRHRPIRGGEEQRSQTTRGLVEGMESEGKGGIEEGSGGVRSSVLTGVGRNRIQICPCSPAWPKRKIQPAFSNSTLLCSPEYPIAAGTGRWWKTR